jgi:cytochrome P450
VSGPPRDPGETDLGETVGELMAGAGRLDPYPLYERIRQHGPLAAVQERFFVATGYDVIDAILRDPRLLVGDQEVAAFYGSTGTDRQADAIGVSLLRANPPDHTRMRRLVSGAFTARRVAAMRSAVTAQAENLTGYLAQIARDGEPVDFITEFAYPLPIRVICALLGVPVGDSAWFREQAAALTVTLEPSFLLADATAPVAARAELAAYFRDLIAQRRARPAEDLTTALVQAHDADGTVLSAEELMATLILLLVAGFETTTNLLGNGLHALLTRPEQAAALRADPALAGNVVEEILRHDSPVTLTFRWNREAVAFAGVAMPPYSQVMVLLAAGNRDPARFADPSAFDPTREPEAPLSFGGGAHYCVGAALARMEAQVALPLLLQRLPTLRLHGEPVRRERLVLRGFAELPVTVA